MAVITPLYLDTSVAIKLFMQEEKGAENLLKFLESKEPYSLLSSSLIKLEIQSVIRRISKDESIIVNLDSLQMISSKLLEHIVYKPITEDVIKNAIHLIQISGISSRLRSLDAIHFATFQLYLSILPNIILLTSDKSLENLAKEYNCKMFNPEG